MTKKTPWKAVRKSRSASPGKRSMFAEMMEGVEALRDERLGKRTLRTHVVEMRASPDVTPAELDRTAREARTLAPGLRRLPAHQSTHPRKLGAGAREAECTSRTPIRLVKRYPDTVQRLATL